MPKFIFEAIAGRYAEAVAKFQEPMAKAATAALKDAGDIVVKESRSAITSAGFSSRFAGQGVRSELEPKGGKPTLDAAVHFFSKIPWFNVFETGKTIVGKPLLWLPLPSVPRGDRGAKQLTPKQYIVRIGPLVSGKSATGTPILLGKISSSRVIRAGSKAFRLRKRRKGSAPPTVNIPLFIGVPAITIPQKFDIHSIVDRTRGRIGELFLRHLKDGK